MSATEIYTFLDKFKNLWSAGLDAHLHAETHAGQAWVSLHLRLGHPPGPLHVISPRRNRNTPARQRRRAQREADRKEKAEEASEKVSENVQPMNENVVDATENVEDSTENVVDAIGDVAAETENEEIVEEPLAEEALVIAEDETVNVAKEDSEKVDIIEIVNAVGTFRNSPNTALGEDDVISLRKFIYSEEDLARNIVDVEFRQIGAWEIEVKLLVTKKNLWEGTRSYIWKHLGGQNFWDRSNGTKIKLEKIHVK